MVNDNYLSIFIIITVITISYTRLKFHNLHSNVAVHLTVLLCIVFLFYIQCEKSAFMTSFLYLIVYVQSHNIKEYFSSSSGLPEFSNNRTDNPKDAASQALVTNNNLPSQIYLWLNGDSFDTTNSRWRDIGNNNHITFNKDTVKVNSGVLFPPRKTSVNSTSSVSSIQKWVSGDKTAQFSIPLSTSNNSVTFIHLTRYSPRSLDRGKLWTNETGSWVSGYNDNNFTLTNENGMNLPITSRSKKIGDIMNIRGSNWNLFIDQMDIKTRTRTVIINNDDYIFETTSLDSIPSKIGINIHSGVKSAWDCAEIMVYPRILDENELRKIIDYFNKKYLIVYLDEIKATKYNIYNRFTFSSIQEKDWQSTQAADSITSNGNTLLGITDSEYDCVELCDKKNSCNAFSYHMEKGTCYSVKEKDILNHNIINNSILSGTNKTSEEKAKRKKEEEERKAREEAERQRLAALEAERQRLAALEAERQRQIAFQLEQQRQAAAAEAARQYQQQLLIQAQIQAQQAAAAAAERARQQAAWYQPIVRFFCFAPETKIEGYEIKDIQLGQSLSASRVISIMKFTVPENFDLFDYNGVRVSSHHMVIEDGKLIKVRDSKQATPIIYNDLYLYNLCTTNNILNADNGTIFADYDEHSSFTEYEKFNLRILRMLNERDHLSSSIETKYHDNIHPTYDRVYKIGVGKGSLVNGIPIEMCQLTDNIDGIITHLREPTDRIFFLDGVYFLEYTKILYTESTGMKIWITIRDHPDATYVENYDHDTFHYITTKNHIVHIDKFICADFVEIDNAFD